MDELVIEALNRQADFSAGFTERIETIRHQLQDRFGVRLTHDSDMNYASAQKLEYQKSGEHNSTFAADLFLSSKAPLFTTGFKMLRAPNEWDVVGREDVPSEFLSDIEPLESHLEKIGWRFVDEKQSEERVVGRTTLLDGAPATVFDLLFAEIR